MSQEPRIVRLKLADGDGRVFTAVELPDPELLATHTRVLGIRDFRFGEGVSVLVVGSDDIDVSAGPVRPDEEPT